MNSFFMILVLSLFASAIGFYKYVWFISIGYGAAVAFIGALFASAIGFYKYVWFISIGYGAAVAFIGAGLLVIFRNQLTIGTLFASILFILYGCRLAGYLSYREVKTAYNRRMKGEVKGNDSVNFIAKVGIWVSAALLYVLETSPVFFRLVNHKGTDLFCILYDWSHHFTYWSHFRNNS